MQKDHPIDHRHKTSSGKPTGKLMVATKSCWLFLSGPTFVKNTSVAELMESG